MNSLRRRHSQGLSPVLIILLVTAAAAQSAKPVARKADEAPFISANEVAMTRMMDGMAVKPTGDVDVDFAAMMIPHHQGAIDMAEAELRYGRNEQLRRIAQEIIVDQQQEIAAMRFALGQPLPLSLAAPTGGGVPVRVAPKKGAADHATPMKMDPFR